MQGDDAAEDNDDDDDDDDEDEALQELLLIHKSTKGVGSIVEWQAAAGPLTSVKSKHCWLNVDEREAEEHTVGGVEQPAEDKRAVVYAYAAKEPYTASMADSSSAREAEYKPHIPDNELLEPMSSFTVTRTTLNLNCQTRVNSAPTDTVTVSRSVLSCSRKPLVDE